MDDFQLWKSFARDIDPLEDVDWDAQEEALRRRHGKREEVQEEGVGQPPFLIRSNLRRDRPKRVILNWTAGRKSVCVRESSLLKGGWICTDTGRMTQNPRWWHLFKTRRRKEDAVFWLSREKGRRKNRQPTGQHPRGVFYAGVCRNGCRNARFQTLF